MRVYFCCPVCQSGCFEYYIDTILNYSDAINGKTICKECKTPIGFGPFWNQLFKNHPELEKVESLLHRTLPGAFL